MSTTCNATHFLTMCRLCKDISTACIGTKQSLYTPPTSLLQPAQTRPVVFDITYLQTKPFRYTLDGDAMGREIRKALTLWLDVTEDGQGTEKVRRFHMWVRADYDELKEPQAPNEVALKVSVLVDFESENYEAEASAMLKALPTKITNQEMGVDFSLHGEWVAWTRDEEEHDSSYRLKWFGELVEAAAPFMIWSNLSFNEDGSAVGRVEDEDFAEHLVYIPIRKPDQKRRVSGRRRSVSQVRVGRAGSCSLM